MEKVPVWILRGVAALFGVLAIVVLLNGSVGAFFGLAVFCLAFSGFAWAFRRLATPTESEKEHPVDMMALVIPVVFGGAGVVMLIGAVLFFFNDRTDATIGLGIFGSIFTTVGFLVRRMMAVPDGMKEVAVNHVERVVNVGTQTRVETSTEYVLVDANMSPEAVAVQQKDWAERPWTQRKDWVDGNISDEAALSTGFLVFFTLLWNAFSWLFTGIFLSGGIKNYPWLASAFPLFGIALIVLTVRNWLRKRKFGTSVFRCQTVPAWLGGQLQGTVTTERAGRGMAQSDFKLRLVCLRKVLHRARKASDNTESEERLWEDTATALPRLGGPSPVEIPIDIPIPNNQPPTTMAPDSSRTFWRLYVSCEVPGVDYKAVFEVPVFAQPGDNLAG